MASIFKLANKDGITVERSLADFTGRMFQRAGKFAVKTEESLKTNGCGKVGAAFVRGIVMFFNGDQPIYRSGEYPLELTQLPWSRVYKYAYVPIGQEPEIGLDQGLNMARVQFVGRPEKKGILSYYEITPHIPYERGRLKGVPIHKVPSSIRWVQAALQNTKTKVLDCRYVGHKLNDSRVYWYAGSVNVSNETRSLLTEYLDIGAPRTKCPTTYN